MKTLFEGQDIDLDYDENNNSYRISLFFQGHWHGEMFYCPETGILEDDEGHILKDGDGFKYHEEIDEEKLEKIGEDLANDYVGFICDNDIPSTTVDDFVAGFKAVYKKAKEE